MKKRTIAAVAAATALAAAVAAGCGAATTAGGAATGSAAGAASTAPAAGGAPVATTTQPAGALTGEAAAAATGDIPDNQVFLRLTDPAGFSMKYPEGWAQRRSRGALVIQDKNNIVRVAVSAGATPTTASVGKEMAALQQQSPTLKAGVPATVTVSGRPAIKVTYTTRSAADPVTGKTVTLQVDRYYLWNAGKIAVVDLGTPVGVDNVDAYRMMIESFAWK